jgi:hypothetical protein
VDTRSGAAELLSHPEGALEDLSKASGTTFPNLASARAHTPERLATLRRDIGPLCESDRFSIVLFGSWARRELTPHSDDDWAILVGGEASVNDSDVEAALAATRDCLGQGAAKPGSQEIFGLAFRFDDLVTKIGLDDDTNTNLTRRMLLLLESVPVSGQEVWEACRNEVLERYLARGLKSHRPPRFLLNDLVRYWRTICVDFEGKHPLGGEGGDQKWVTRNAKLRTSRKMLFAGGLIPVLMCHLREVSEMPEFLRAQLHAPPTDRLAAAFLAEGMVDEGARTLAAYDKWVGLLQNELCRKELLELTEATRESSRLFQQITGLGRQLDRGLLALLFDTQLGGITRNFGIF